MAEEATEEADSTQQSSVDSRDNPFHKRDATLRRSNGIRLPSKRGSPWREKNLRRRQDWPVVKPPLPPKPTSLSYDRRGRLLSFSSLDMEDGEVVASGLTSGRQYLRKKPSMAKPPRKFSSPVTSSPQKMAVSRSRSSHVLGGTSGSQQKIGELIAKRKQFFHQLSQSSSMEGSFAKTKTIVEKKVSNKYFSNSSALFRVRLI